MKVPNLPKKNKTRSELKSTRLWKKTSNNAKSPRRKPKKMATPKTDTKMAMPRTVTPKTDTRMAMPKTETPKTDTRTVKPRTATKPWRLTTRTRMAMSKVIL